MKAALRQRARELGFDDCRFTTANPPESAAHFRRWLADGRHGQMAWLERNAPKRVDPPQVLSDARSIITLAASYHDPPGSFTLPGSNVQPQRAPQGSGLADTPATGSDCQTPIAMGQLGLIARYARYADYHDVLGEGLRRLTQYLNELGGEGTRSLWYVDTGPLLERDFAQRSGLGFIGKHTNLISRQLGNWIFLAEIITTVQLEPDPPEKNHCGSCTRCITACPTAAITAPFQLDARRCISYLTIELRGSIPVELRPAIGNRIFGCDDCLEVCPWNRFAREGELMRKSKRKDLDQPDLIDLLGLDDAGFKRCFEGTPILRTRRRGLLRNVCVALGNCGDEHSLPALRKAAQDPEPLVAEHARWAIGEIERKRCANY